MVGKIKISKSLYTVLDTNGLHGQRWAFYCSLVCAGASFICFIFESFEWFGVLALISLILSISIVVDKKWEEWEGLKHNFEVQQK